jgi:hypothetical protein
LYHITIPSSVAKISQSPFSCCNTTIEISTENNHFTIFDGKLYTADKTRLISYISKSNEDFFDIPDSVDEIGNLAFNGCGNLTRLKMSDNVITVGEYAFFACKNIRDIYISNKLTTIGDGAFGACASLKSITLPSSVTYIGNEAFNYCYSLTDVYFNGSKRNWEKISIGENNDILKNAKIHFKTLFGYTK